MKNFFRRLKYFLFVPHGITAEPKSSDAVISDLFLIRNDSQWKTEFELLNIRGLIEGDNTVLQNDTSDFWFFDETGEKLGEERIGLLGVGRQTVKLRDLLTGPSERAKTFAVFHNQTVPWLASEKSFLADRGYAGFEFSNIGLKGYVHGNLDAVALVKGKVEPLGNSGLISRYYTVQHCLRGPAKYEFVFTNPTSKNIKIIPNISLNQKKWETKESFTMNSLGSHTFTVDIKNNEKAIVRFKSRLYLGRPVVFRIADNYMDVFHG